jgi:hypothetical protein
MFERSEEDYMRDKFLSAAPTHQLLVANRRISLAACALALVFGLSARAASPTVLDTGYEIPRVAPLPSLHWIDNNRLLFAGYKTPDSNAAFAAREQYRDARLRKLYLWDATTRSVRPYADAQSVCVSQGVISYAVKEDKVAGKQVVKEGPFGSEREFERPIAPAESVRSNFTCKSHLRQELVPPAPRFRHVVVLHEGDGYLDLKPGGGPNLLEELRAPKRNLKLYQANGKGIELPITWDEQFTEFDVAFSDYRNAYVLRPHAPRGSSIGISEPWPQGQPLVMYLLWADGQVKRMAIPYLPTEHLISPHPTRVGFLFGGGKSPRSTGLYVFDGKTQSKLEAGFVYEIAVTADGCKAAVGINSRPYDMGAPISIRIFTLCMGD